MCDPYCGDQCCSVHGSMWAKAANSLRIFCWEGISTFKLILLNIQIHKHLLVPRRLVCPAHSWGPIQSRGRQMHPRAIWSLRQRHDKRVQHGYPRGWLVWWDLWLGGAGRPRYRSWGLDSLLFWPAWELLDPGHGLWVLHCRLFLRWRTNGNEVWVGLDLNQGAESLWWVGKHQITILN